MGLGGLRGRSWPSARLYTLFRHGPPHMVPASPLHAVLHSESADAPYPPNSLSQN